MTLGKSVANVFTFIRTTNIDRNFFPVSYWEAISHLKQTSLSFVHNVTYFITYYSGRVRTAKEERVRKLSRVQRVKPFSGGGGAASAPRIIIDPFARRIHEVARPSTERDRTVVRRGFTWLLLIYYEPAGFAKDYTAAAAAAAAVRDCPSWKVSPPADRSGVSWNLLVTRCLRCTVTLLRNNVSRRFVDTARSRTARRGAPRERVAKRDFASGDELWRERRS